MTAPTYVVPTDAACPPLQTAPPVPTSRWRRFVDRTINPLADLDLSTLDLADIEADLARGRGRRPLHTLDTLR